MTSRSGVLGVQLAGWGWVGKGVQDESRRWSFFLYICVHVSTSNATFLLQVGVSFI